MPELPKPELVPVEELDRLEWLSRESLWSLMKSPYSLQWERWQRQTAVEDNDSVTGLVINGNLQRATTALRNAKNLAAADGRPDPELTSLAAEHIGKMAGGLIGIVTHFDTPSQEWELPLNADIVADHVITAASVIAHAKTEQETTLEASDYYDLLRPVVANAKLADIMPTMVKTPFLREQVPVIHKAAAIAVASWEEVLVSQPGLSVVPGATPRSSGDEIFWLRHDFEDYVPAITSTVDIYRDVPVGNLPTR